MEVLIIRNLMKRNWRFNELQRSLDGISQKVLTDSLRQLYEYDFVFIKNYRIKYAEEEMDITFEVDNQKFNYRVCGIIINNQKILAMRDECSPYYYLPGGRVKPGETAEEAILREMLEELQIIPNIIRPLWLEQSFFTEDVNKKHYHELCLYFLLDITQTKLLSLGNDFTYIEGTHTHHFSWLKFEDLKDTYFYPEFIKNAITQLPNNLKIYISKK